MLPWRLMWRGSVDEPNSAKAPSEIDTNLWNDWGWIIQGGLLQVPLTQLNTKHMNVFKFITQLLISPLLYIVLPLLFLPLFYWNKNPPVPLFLSYSPAEVWIMYLHAMCDVEAPCSATLGLIVSCVCVYSSVFLPNLAPDLLPRGLCRMSPIERGLISLLDLCVLRNELASGDWGRQTAPRWLTFDIWLTPVKHIFLPLGAT